MKLLKKNYAWNIQKTQAFEFYLINISLFHSKKCFPEKSVVELKYRGRTLWPLLNFKNGWTFKTRLKLNLCDYLFIKNCNRMQLLSLFICMLLHMFIPTVIYRSFVLFCEYILLKNDYKRYENHQSQNEFYF